MGVIEVFEFIEKNNIKWINFAFFGVDGRQYNTAMPARELTEDSFRKGVHNADLTEVYGWAEQGELLLMPDPDTFGRVPWETATARLLCSVVSAKNREGFLKDPRGVSKRVEVTHKAMGFDRLETSGDVEFYIFDAITVDKVAPERGANVLIDARESPWNPSPLWTKDNKGFIDQPYDSLYTARSQSSEVLEDNFNYSIVTHSHGRAVSSQQRMVIQKYSLTTAADAMNTLKYVVKNLAMIANTSATFMPYPVTGETGSGLKIHQSLWKRDDNVMFDPKDENKQLSQYARYYIGGLLEHANALSIFTNPSTNSYRKLIVDPRYVTWSTKSEYALVYVNTSIRNEKHRKHITFTGADASVNPHLAYSAIAAAGLDGIRNKMEPGDPVEADLKGMKTKERRDYGIGYMATNLIEAVESFESDNKFLKGMFPAEIIGEYMDRRLEEYKENETKPTAYEFTKYFNV